MKPITIEQITFFLVLAGWQEIRAANGAYWCKRRTSEGGWIRRPGADNFKQGVWSIEEAYEYETKS